MKKLLVLYKTHLDVGFTDFSANIVDLYLKKYIPNAINTAMTINEGGEKRFIWQTGSWILNEYLCSVTGEELARAEYAIKNEYIAWHALPFTAHTELFSKELLEYGLHISKTLDKKYGKRTTAAKSTDVPGMTKAMIKPLYEAGVRFLHIGVNGASPVPDVPNIFVWRADSGEEIIVMYNERYGGFTKISDECSITFQFAGDNLEPMTKDMVAESFEALKREYPDTLVIPATLNDVAAEVEKIRDSLPILTQEIGDSWIHGVMTDPRKVFEYQAALRYAQSADLVERETLYKGLLMIPEHTWGVDEKTFLADRECFDKKCFYQALRNENFQNMEKSWQEQRDYIHDRVAIVNSPMLDRMLSEYKRNYIQIESCEEKLPYDIKINDKGEITSLTLGGRKIADETHPLCSFSYEVFSEEEYERFISRYNRLARRGEEPLEWMLEDFTKIGMASGNDTYRQYVPSNTSVAYDGNCVVVDCKMPEEACEKYGCPRQVQYVLRFENNRMIIDFAWFGKDKNRIAEAMWLTFTPIVADCKAWRIEKIDQMIDPFDHVSLGGVQHYTAGKLQNKDVTMRLLDGGLVSFDQPNLLLFDAERADGKAVSFNLYNNIWGTNFPMWYDEDGRIRVELEIEEE